MIPERFKARCHWCGDEIDTRRKAGNFRHGSGWFQSRTQGGTNAVHLPQMDDLYACKWCVEKQGLGQAQYQLNLFS